jgi:hypothetical protein
LHSTNCFNTVVGYGGVAMKQIAVIHGAFETAPRLVAFVDVTKQHETAETENMEKHEATELMLEKAWELTNSIDHPWVQNKEVTVVGDPKLRSTSVGDHLLLDGEKWEVASFGFTRVAPPSGLTL